MHGSLLHAPMQGSFFDEAYRQNPFAVYDGLRQSAPVIWNEPLSAWIVTGYDEVRTVLQSARVYSSDRVHLGRERFPDPVLTPLFDMIELLMVQRDEPQHNRLRRMVAKAFGKTEMDRFVQMIEARVDGLLAETAGADTVDFVSAVSVPLPVLVISEIIGIPAKDRKKVKRWCDSFSFVALNFYARITDEQLANGLAAVQSFSTYLKDQVDQRRANPTDDLLSALVAVEEEGDRLSFDELLANTVLLLNAGNETTTVLLSNLMHRIATTPKVQDRLRADPDQIAEAVEESLRHTAPVHFLGRIVTQETVLGGETLQAGDLVLVFIGSAGRDPAHYADPAKFSLDRGKIAHLSFGSGPHVCAGLQLARLEARVATAMMLNRFSDISMAGTDLGIGPNLNLRNVERLPLALTPA